MAVGAAEVEEALLGDLQEDVSIANLQEWASSVGFIRRLSKAWCARFRASNMWRPR